MNFIPLLNVGLPLKRLRENANSAGLPDLPIQCPAKIAK
jgi:hypothetical protein